MNRALPVLAATLLAATLLAATLLAAPLAAQAPTPARGAAALGELVAGLGVSARVLVIAAHPDDEDTRLISFLSRGRHADVAYLSLTRGDGGQNLIGNELGEALGALRTEELLAARRVDGARQYFTRAYDFGFSKNAEETFRHWPHEEVLRDVVTVVRAFRPHVIVAVFSGTPRDGHGHHQASGILAREAFDAAADTVRFPRAHTAGWAAWIPAKFYRTRSYWQGEGATFVYDAGEYSPLLGRSYAEIAAESRSQHRSQGFGSIQRRGPVQGSVRLEASRVAGGMAAGAAERSMFAGLDTTYARLRPALTTAGGRAVLDAILASVGEVRRTFDAFDPSRLLAPLTRLDAALGTVRREIGARPCDGSRAGGATEAVCDAARSAADLQRRVDRALALAGGLAVDATVPREVVARGDSAAVAVAVYNRGGATARVNGVVPVFASAAAASAPAARMDAPAQAPVMGSVMGAVWQDTLRAAARTLTQPWWLARPRAGDMFTVPVDGTAEDERRPAAFVSGAVQLAPASGGHAATVGLDESVVYRVGDPVRGDVSRPLAVVPAVSVTLDQTALMLPANAPVDRIVRVTLRSGSANVRSVRVRLTTPQGIAADSAMRTATLPAFGTREVEFRLRGRLPAGRYELRATAESNGERFTEGYTLIDYDHIRPQRLYRPATLALQAVDVQIPPGLRVAYISGVGDNSAPALRALGVDLTVLEPQQLAGADLSRFTTVVVGPRAYEAVPELRATNARLLDWVRRGGTMVVQYGQGEMQEPGVMPYPITLDRRAQRVTIEEAPVAVLDPRARVLVAPNRIAAGDFAGWVQDRTVYMPRTFDPRYQAPLSTNDPGEPPNRGALLVAPYGQGTYVYTTLAFFRQLPNGVPGAARLFVNLLAAGSAGAAVPSAVPSAAQP